MEIEYHPLFERWLAELAEGDQEIFGDVMALLTALEDYGRDLDDEAREESHPVVTARYDLHALRRTPPTEAAPTPQVHRCCGFCTPTAGEPEMRSPSY